MQFVPPPANPGWPPFLKLTTQASSMRTRFRLPASLLLGALLAVPATAQAPAASRRPMTFLDMQHMKQIGAPTPSPDGKWLLYTLSTPDWKEGKRQTDIHLVSLERRS